MAIFRQLAVIVLLAAGSTASAQEIEIDADSQSGQAREKALAKAMGISRKEARSVVEILLEARKAERAGGNADALRAEADVKIKKLLSPAKYESYSAFVTRRERDR